jgi:hypothetical protein
MQTLFEFLNAVEMQGIVARAAKVVVKLLVLLMFIVVICVKDEKVPNLSFGQGFIR